MKGTWCNIKESVFCQENYCSNCEIYVKWDRLLGEINTTMNQLGEADER